MYARLKPKAGYLEARCRWDDCGELLGFVYQNDGTAATFKPALPRKHGARAAPADRAERLKLRAPLYRLQEKAERLQNQALPVQRACGRCGHEQIIDL